MTADELHITVEEWKGQGTYVARIAAPFPYTGAGRTPEEAVTNLRELYALRVEHGPPPPPPRPVAAGGDPWAELTATRPDPEVIDQWRRCIEENRLDGGVGGDPWAGVIGIWDEQTYQAWQAGIEEVRDAEDAEAIVMPRSALGSG